jgi:hypothetical protein
LDQVAHKAGRALGALSHPKSGLTLAPLMLQTWHMKRGSRSDIFAGASAVAILGPLHRLARFGNKKTARKAVSLRR